MDMHMLMTMHILILLIIPMRTVPTVFYFIINR